MANIDDLGHYHYSSGTFAPLVHALHDAWHGQYDLEVFQRTLRDFSVLLSNPVERGPNEADRQQIRAKKVELPGYSKLLDLQDMHVSAIIEFSDALHVNEKMCVQLLVQAAEDVKHMHRQSSSSSYVVAPTFNDVKARAIQLYETKRRNLLVALLDLILLYEKQDYPEDLVMTVNEFVREMVRENFVQNLLTLMKNLVDCSSTVAVYRRVRDRELWDVTQVLFYLLRLHEITSAHTRALLATFRYISNVALTKPRDSHMNMICNVMLCSFMACLDNKLQSGVVGSTYAVASHDEDLKQFIAVVVEEIGGGVQWKHREFKNLVLLVWVVFMHRTANQSDNINMDTLSTWTNEALGLVASSSSSSSSSVTFAIGGGGQQSQHPQQQQQPPPIQVFALLLHNFLQSSRFIQTQPQHQLKLCEVLGEFINSFIIFNFDEVRKLFDAQKMSRSSSAPQATSMNFSCLLQVIGLVCKFAPSTAELFWARDNEEFVHFLRFVDEHITIQSPLLEPYVLMVESLCATGVSGFPDYGARQMYQLLDRSRNLNFHKIFGNFHYLKDLYLKQQQGNPSLRLDGDNATKVKCMLRIVQSVVRSRVIQESLYRDTKLRVIEVLFGLLACQFDHHLKAELLKTVCACAKDNSEIAVDVWFRLEESQILPTKPMTNAASASSSALASTSALASSSSSMIGGRGVYGSNGSDGSGGGGGAYGSGNVPTNLRGGIVHDLEAVETDAQSYPLTSAFVALILELMYAVKDMNGGSNSSSNGGGGGGASRRNTASVSFYGTSLPNALPYVEFIRKNVFLSVDDRQYRSPHERWQLIELCLCVFCKCVDDFDPVNSDAVFESFIRDMPSHRQAGFDLMLQMCTNQALFRKVIDVLIRSQHSVEMTANRTQTNGDGSDGNNETKRNGDHATTATTTASFIGAQQQQQQQPNATAAAVATTTGLAAGGSDAEMEAQAVQASLTLCLRLLATVLSKEHAFLERLRARRPDATLRATSEMLMQNPRHVIAIAKSIGIQQDAAVLNDDTTSANAQDDDTGDSGGGGGERIVNGQLCYYASSVIRLLCTQDHNVMVDVFENARVSVAIIQGWADQLRNIQPPRRITTNDLNRSAGAAGGDDGGDGTNWQRQQQHQQQQQQDDMYYEDAEYVNKCHTTIVEILLMNMSSPTPNLSQLLLGFDVSDIVHTDLRISDRSMLLETILELCSKPHFGEHHPQLASLCYELLYRVVAEYSTSRPFLSYLQVPTSMHDELVFFRILDGLPHPLLFANDPLLLSTSLMQRAWLLKAIAMQLHLTARRVENSSDFLYQALQHLGLATGELSWYPRVLDVSFGGGGGGGGHMARDMEPDTPGNQQHHHHHRDGGGGALSDLHVRMLEVLDVLSNLPIPQPAPMPSVIGREKTDSVKVYTSSVSFQYDIRALYFLVLMQTNNSREAESICERAIQWNHFNIMLSACLAVFNGWRETLEVCLYEIFDVNTQQESEPERYEDVLFQLLTGILQKLSAQGAGSRVWSVLSEQLSSTALTVVTKLREQVGSTNGRKATESDRVFELIVTSILQHTLHSTRAHLYGVFMNYMQYLRDLKSGVTGYANANDVLVPEYSVSYTGQLDVTQNQQTLQQRNLQLLERVSGKLLQLVVQDASDGQTQLRPMAFVFLNSLLSVSNAMHTRCLLWFESKDTLAHFINEIVSRDRFIHAAVFSSNVRDYDHIVTYQHMMSLMAHVTIGTAGAKLLVDLGVVRMLNQVSFLQHRPDTVTTLGSHETTLSQLFVMETHTNGADLMPSHTERYLSLFVPTWHFLSVILSSLPRHRVLHLQVVEFVIKHTDIITSLLKDAPRHLVHDGEDELANDTRLLLARATSLIACVFYALYTGPLSRKPSSQQQQSESEYTRAFDDIRKFEPFLLHYLSGFARSYICTGREMPTANAMDIDTGAAAAAYTRQGAVLCDVADETCRCILAIWTIICMRRPPPRVPASAEPLTSIADSPDIARLSAILGHMIEKSSDAVSREATFRHALDSLETTSSVEDLDLGSTQLQLPETVNANLKKALAYRQLYEKLVESVKQVLLGFFCIENGLQILWILRQSQQFSRQVADVVKPLLAGMENLLQTASAHGRTRPKGFRLHGSAAMVAQEGVSAVQPSSVLFIESMIRKLKQQPEFV